PERASRRRILSIRACIVNLLRCVRTIVEGGGAGATPALPLGRRRTDADLTERPSGASKIAAGPPPPPHLREGAATGGARAGRRGPFARESGAPSRAPCKRAPPKAFDSGAPDRARRAPGARRTTHST